MVLRRGYVRTGTRGPRRWHSRGSHAAGAGRAWWPSRSNPVGGVPRGGRARQAHVHPEPRVGVLLSMYLGQAVESARRGILGVRDEDLHPLPLRGHCAVDPLEKLPAVLVGTDHDGFGVLHAQLPHPLLGEEIDLVEAENGLGDSSTVAFSERLGEGASDGPDLIVQLRARRVRTQHLHVGVARSLQSRGEGVDELGGQLPYETDGVGDDEVRAGAVLSVGAGALHETRGRLQSLEEPISGGPRLAAQSVQDRGLSGVGVAYKRDGGRPLLLEPGAADGPGGPLFLELAVYCLHPPADRTPVVLQLLLARPPGQHGAAAEAAELGVPALDPGKPVLQIRELDLEV